MHSWPYNTYLCWNFLSSVLTKRDEPQGCWFSFPNSRAMAQITLSSVKPWKVHCLHGLWNKTLLQLLYLLHTFNKWSHLITHSVPAAFIPQDIFLVLISVRRRVNRRAIVRPEGSSQRNIPKTSSEIEPPTLQLVLQCLNQLYQHMPPLLHINL
jgi:hypothetical protein